VAAVRVADIAELILDRRSVYSRAYQGDLDRLARQHGPGPVADAVRLIEEHNQAAEPWDRAGHEQAVREGIERTIVLRRLAGLSSLSE
jgi:hypothetical protein